MDNEMKSTMVFGAQCIWEAFESLPNVDENSEVYAREVNEASAFLVACERHLLAVFGESMIVQAARAPLAYADVCALAQAAAREVIRQSDSLGSGEEKMLAVLRAPNGAGWLSRYALGI